MKLRSQGSATKVETGRRRRAGSGEPRPRSIALDGPSAVGKSAVGSRVAARLGYRFIDTGMMYRALTWLALEQKIDLEDEAALARLAGGVALTVEPGPPRFVGESGLVRVEGIDVTEKLRPARVEAAVSLVSRVPGVREAMVANQRALAREGRVVMAGRDIGTVVLPDAPLKVYLDASIEERARRRHEELRTLGRKVAFQRVQDDLARRDAIDSGRAVSPLRPAADAVVIDTDKLSLEEVVTRILVVVPCHS